VLPHQVPEAELQQVRQRLLLQDRLERAAAVAAPVELRPCGYTSPQIRGAYGLDQALKHGYDGRGAAVAVIGAYASPTILSDAKTYARRNDRSRPLRDYQFAQSTPASHTDTAACDAPGWYGKETLNVEAVLATAPAASILYIGPSSCNDNDLNAAVNSVVDNGLAPVVTNSYGNSGEPKTIADVAARSPAVRGFLNPTLYKLNGSSASHDIDHSRTVTGVVRVAYITGVDASAGTRTSLRTLGQTGSIYTRPGYDDVAGVGIPNGVAFLGALAQHNR